MGLFRDMTIAAVLGATRASDAFWVAFTVPNVFRRFVADEGLTGALIPGIASEEKKQGKESARRLANSTFSMLVLVCVFLILTGELFSPQLVKAFAYGFSSNSEQFALTVSLTRLMLPFVIFVSLVSFSEALLNYEDHFFIPKIAPGIVSGGIIAGALFFTDFFEHKVYGLAVGVLAGGLFISWFASLRY